MKKIYNSYHVLVLLIVILSPFFLYSQSNQYLHFDREDDFVELEGASQYIANIDEFSIAGWFYCDELAYGQGMMGFRTTGNGFYLIQLNNGQVECRLETTDGLFEVVAPNNSTVPQVWQHWTWVYDGSQIMLFINGIFKGIASATGQITNTNFSFAIGKSILGGFNFVYGGRVDEVSVWTKALSSDDIEDIMENELTGTEDELVLYYKFNQGDPGGDNTSITELVSEIGEGERDAELINFTMSGETSNFNGTVEIGYQAISFSQIPNKLNSDDPFQLEATASSGLEVYFEVVSGPATIDGNLVTLTGDAGEVIIKASQPGDEDYEPAEDVLNSFMVIDPLMNVPDIDPRSPLEGNVYVPELSEIQLAAISYIDYPELFFVQSLEFQVDTTIIPAYDWGEGHYAAWWTPPAYGNYTINIIARNNFGASVTNSVNINVVDEAEDMEILAVDDIWINTDFPSVVVDAELPSYIGAFDQITATLDVNCPPGGCGEWDRKASIDAKGHNGEWIEIVRYITPYGTECSHTIDLTDYMSILQGKISFRVNCGTLDNGYMYDLTLNYSKGSPAYKYSAIDVIWQDEYQFGDMANLQPVEAINYTFPDNTESALIKLVSTGHGWGPNNTDNAAEFHEDTHHIWVDGEQTFEQHNWNDCNPNPDDCQPQNGTWIYDRAGWCPGSIAPWFDFNMNDFIESESVELKYIFDEDYVDYCHPNNPDCVTGETCENCDDGYNPHLIVACNMVCFSDVPIDGSDVTGINDHHLSGKSLLSFYPNPSDGIIQLTFEGDYNYGQAILEIFNSSGKPVMQFEWNGENRTIDISSFPNGIYLMKVSTEKYVEVQKIVLQ